MNPWIGSLGVSGSALHSEDWSACFAVVSPGVRDQCVCMCVCVGCEYTVLPLLNETRVESVT